MCYVDVDGRFWHIVAGAAVGAVVNIAISVGTSIVKGEKINVKKVIATAAGGAVTGAVTAATGNPTLGAVAGGTVERVGHGVIDGKSAKEICKDVVVGAATDVVFAKAGKAIAKQPQIQKFTESFKSTKLGKRIFDGNTNFKRQITRGRNAFTKENGWKKIVMRKKTYFNGFWGVTGTKALDKSTRVALFHGADPKDSVQEIIALLYDSVYMNYQIQKYVENSLKKIYDEIEGEEIENALCVA